MLWILREASNAHMCTAIDKLAVAGRTHSPIPPLQRLLFNNCTVRQRLLDPASLHGCFSYHQAMLLHSAYNTVFTHMS